MNRENYTAPIQWKDYTVDDPFWSEKMEVVRSQMLPYQWKALNDQIKDAAPSHCIHNFKIAAGLEEGEFEGCVFQDSDVAKWLEAVGYVLGWHKDPELEATADQVIDLIVAAQQPDGYMDTYYIINGLDKRWTNLMGNHELYCAGHMIEAGIAYYEGTGKRVLLDAVIRLADCIERTFGWEEGKMRGYPGHEIIEMALMRLYDLTGEIRYRDLASYFVDERGQEPLYFDIERKKYNNYYYWEDSVFQYQYYQAGLPVREQKVAQGHAVRAMYLYSGMTSVAKETGDDSLWEACRRLWEDVAYRQMYITGAVGASDYGEAFTFDYDLPNDTVYGETCASIGLVFWARRMLEVEVKSEYADVMERALYNTCLSGMSQDGTRFFYVNPLEVNPEACRKDQLKVHVAYERQSWFSCACCPPNLARLLASLGNYVATYRKDVTYVHLYIGGEMRNPQDHFSFTVRSGLPWSGEVEMVYHALDGIGCERELALRIPGWSDGIEVEMNCQKAGIGSDAKVMSDGYLHIRRYWNDGDQLKITFGMPVRINRANPAVRENVGKVAVSRGPVVYCLEEIDNGKELHRLKINTSIRPTPQWSEELGGMMTITAQGTRISSKGWNEVLYSSEVSESYENQELKFIPYYLWNNRGIGEMTVWMRAV